MGDNKGKFELVAWDKNQVVSLVNAIGAEMAEYKNAGLLDKAEMNLGRFLTPLVTADGGRKVAVFNELTKLNLDSHEGRKEFLGKRLGIDASTSDDYRLATYTNDAGQVMLFKGHMDGDKKLVLTDSIAFPDSPDKILQVFQSDFKPLPKPIEVQIEKSTVTPDGVKLDLAPDEQKKLETQSTFAAAIQKSGGIELASNARLPNKPQATGAGLNA